MKSQILSLLSMLFVVSTASALSAKVEVTDVDGEDKSFTFLDSSPRNEIKTKLPMQINCSVSFFTDKNIATLECSTFYSEAKKVKAEAGIFLSRIIADCETSRPEILGIETSGVKKYDPKKVAFSISCSK